MLLLGVIVRRYGVSFHLYANDTQIYLPLKHTERKGLETLFVCLKDISSWMSSNILHLNASETEANVFGPCVCTHFANKATHAFFLSHMDGCSSLYAGISQSSITRLKMVQNSTARFLTGVCKCEHITPILTDF